MWFTLFERTKLFRNIQKPILSQDFERGVISKADVKTLLLVNKQTKRNKKTIRRFRCSDQRFDDTGRQTDTTLHFHSD